MSSRILKTHRGYLALAFAIACVTAVLFIVDRQALLEWLAERQQDAVNFTSTNPWQAIGIAFFVYVVVTASGFPGSTALSTVSATILP